MYQCSLCTVQQCLSYLLSIPQSEGGGMSKRLGGIKGPSQRGENVKTFRWDKRPQIQNLFMAFNGAPRVWAEKYIFCAQNTDEIATRL